jgi:hypothetical protein
VGKHDAKLLGRIDKQLVAFVAIFLGAGANENSRKENSDNQGHDKERRIDIHRKDSLKLE